ncbi:MAG: ThiF family adenylyltransferase [Acutalibacteraceae bacterium]
MSSQYERSELLFGEGSTQLLKDKKVIVFGAGGVGSYVLEALSRAGVGTIAVCDSDTVALSNINRQLIATHKTVGTDKVEAVRQRIHDIDPEINVIAIKKFLTKDNLCEFSLTEYDYIVDAIDTVSAKIALAVFAERNDIPLISSMGTGNKLSPERFRVSDIYKTSVCPLARVMRCELRKRGVRHLKVVWSDEEAISPENPIVEGKRIVPGSAPFVPGAAGLIIAGEVIKDLIK